MTRAERDQRSLVLHGTADAIRALGEQAARDAGLDQDTSDAVGHAVAARVLDEQAVGAAIRRIVVEEVQRHAQP